MILYQLFTCFFVATSACLTYGILLACIGNAVLTGHIISDTVDKNIVSGLNSFLLIVTIGSILSFFLIRIFESFYPWPILLFSIFDLLLYIYLSVSIEFFSKKNCKKDIDVIISQNNLSKS